MNLIPGTPLTVKSYLMGRDKIAPITKEMSENALLLITLANCVLEDFGEYRTINSGYRDPETNRKAGGSPRSKHLTCQAIDLEDRDRELKIYCMKRLDLLEKYDLYMEHPDKTPTWVHLQLVAPKSGNRVFYP